MSAVRVQEATAEDFVGWIRLAQEVEPLFGPMVADPGFQAGLRQAIADRNAFCVRLIGWEDGLTLPGGIVISREDNEILWFAVAEASRGQGIGDALLRDALNRLDHRRPITVMTFDGSVEAGLPARKLYQRHGFIDSHPVGLNPAGIPTVIMVRLSNRS